MAQENAQTMLQKLQADQKATRIDAMDKSKLADKEFNTIKASLLTSLFSESADVGKKNGNRVSTDTEVMDVIKIFAKNLKSNITNYEKAGKADALKQAQTELSIVNTYLPQTVSADEVEAFVKQVMLDKGLKQESSNMGKIMGELKAKYGASLDGTVASAVVKKALTPA